MMMAFILLVAPFFLNFAAADQISIEPTAFEFAYNGKEAESLYQAFANAGALEKEGRLSIDNVFIMVKANQNLGDSDPCFGVQGFDLTFQDLNQASDDSEDAPWIKIYEDCRSQKAKDVYEALLNVGNSKLKGDCRIMGFCGYTASDLSLHKNPLDPAYPKNQYWAMGELGNRVKRPD